jgi:hypothetical protein
MAKRRSCAANTIQIKDFRKIFGKTEGTGVVFGKTEGTGVVFGKTEGTREAKRKELVRQNGRIAVFGRLIFL